MSPTIAQIDDAARIYSYRRLTSAVPSQSSIVLGLNDKIERWRRVTELSKNAEGDLSAWARCAVRFDDADSASKALDAIPAPDKETADYHALRSDVALIRHDLVGYEKELLEAKRRDPQDKKYDLALATLHVAASDFATHEVGVRELLALRDDESFHRDAIHRLADDALRRNQITRALEYARDLDSLSNRDFSDRLLLLSILEAANGGE